YVIDLLRCQVLVVVEVKLEHRRRAARAETLNLAECEASVSGRFTNLDSEFLRTVFGDLPGAADVAREGLADLNVILANRFGVDHRVEGRDFPDVGHAK